MDNYVRLMYHAFLTWGFHNHAKRWYNNGISTTWRGNIEEHKLGYFGKYYKYIIKESNDHI